MDVSEHEVAAAAAYEDLHVPALFGQWAPRVADATELQQGQRVLDVACGTGILAREAKRRVGVSGFVAGIDATPGMIAVAERLEPSVEWRVGVAESLPYDSDSFDAVVSQFGLMFFPDRFAAVSEMLRVLAPRGRLAVAVWESLDRSEAYPIEVELLQRVAGQEAADALRAPFALGNPSELTSIFTEAGANSVAISTSSGTARFPSIRAMVEADLRGWLPVMGVVLEEETVQEILDSAERDLAQFVTEAGTVEFRSAAHIVTATS